MNFGSGRSKPKAWKDVWGCGQGIAVVKEIPAAGELIARLISEYDAAFTRLGEIH